MDLALYCLAWIGVVAVLGCYLAACTLKPRGLAVVGAGRAAAPPASPVPPAAPAV